MKDGLTVVTCLFAVVVCTYLIVMTEVAQKNEIYKVNCDAVMGGWHPDIPQKYRELCEEARKYRSDR